MRKTVTVLTIEHVEGSRNARISVVQRVPNTQSEIITGWKGVRLASAKGQAILLLMASALDDVAALRGTLLDEELL